MQDQLAIVQLKNGQKKYGQLIFNETMNQLVLLPVDTLNKILTEFINPSQIINKDEIQEIDFCLK
jgi:hypothetical protein